MTAVTTTKIRSGYPHGLTFWDTKAVKMKIINPDDLRLSTVLKILNIESSPLCDSFGVSDESEILRRQRIVRFLMKNTKIRKFIRDIDRSSIGIPYDGQQFIGHFSQKSPFWSRIMKFCKLVRKASDVPQEISSFVRALERMLLNARPEEELMAKGMMTEMLRSAFLEGQVRICLYDKKGYRLTEGEGFVTWSAVYGYKKYSYRLSGKFAEAGIVLHDNLQIVQDFIEGILAFVKQGLLYSPLLIRNLPQQVADDMETVFLKNICHENPLKRLSTTGILSNHLLSLDMDIRYCESGLMVRVVDIILNPDEKALKNVPEMQKSEYIGYGLGQKAREWKRIGKIKYRIQEDILSGYKTYFKEKLEELFPGITTGYTLLPSPKTDTAFKWFSVAVLSENPSFTDDFKKAQSRRNGFCKHLVELDRIAYLAEQFDRKSKEWGLECCFPTILDEETHLVESKNLQPIHLLGRTKDTNGAMNEPKSEIGPTDLVALATLPPLNGRMIGLTGRNAEGKTVALEIMAYAIYLAQSGLPIFADSFALNVKGVLGVAFMERGQNSTAHLLIIKIRNILAQIVGMEKEKIVLLFDEVGGGTQEGGIDATTGKASGGFGLGVRLFKTVKEHGCSVIFSTQILGLAQFAEEELGADCYRFGINHSLLKGIGSGEIETLIQTSGLDELLVD